MSHDLDDELVQRVAIHRRQLDSTRAISRAIRRSAPFPLLT
jgi:hypothetical protein